MTSEQMRSFREAVLRNNDGVVPWSLWETVCNAFGVDSRDDVGTQRLYDAIVRAADRLHGGKRGGGAVTEPTFPDGQPLPRCQYCGEFFYGSGPSSQVCADCHEHIVAMESELVTVIAERDRLAAENEALCAFVDVVDDYEAEFDGVQPIIDARAAIEPILAARRARERG